MNARVAQHLLARPSNRHLDALEEEAIFVLREVAGAFERPARKSSPGLIARVQGAQPMLG